jgi:WD40 repeat protein
MAFSPDGKTLAVANYDGVVKLCDLTTGREADLPSPYPYAEEQGIDWYNKLAFSHRGQRLAVAYTQRSIVIREITRSEASVRIPLDNAGVHSMAFTDDDQALVTLLLNRPGVKPVSLSAAAVRWDVSSGKRLSTIDLGADSSFEVLSPNGRYAVAETTSRPGAGPLVCRYDVVDLTTGAALFQVGGSDFDPDWAVLAGSWAFSADGSTLVTCNQKGLLVREVPSGRELRRFGTAYIASTHGASLSSDRRLLAVTTGCLVSLFDLEAGKLLGDVNAGQLAACTVALLSPDGRTLATQRATVGSNDKPVSPLLRAWRIPESLRSVSRPNQNRSR